MISDCRYQICGATFVNIIQFVNDFGRLLKDKHTGCHDKIVSMCDSVPVAAV